MAPKKREFKYDCQLNNYAVDDQWYRRLELVTSDDGRHTGHLA